MNPNGNGFGLNICRMLIGFMGGKLTATSKQSVGSCFTISLNLQKFVNKKPDSLVNQITGE